MCFFGSVSTCINRCYITLVKPWFMHISPIFGKSLEMVHGLGFPHFNPLNPIHFPQIWWLVYNCFSQYLMVIPYFQTHPEIRLLTYTSKFSTDIPIYSHWYPHKILSTKPLQTYDIRWVISLYHIYSIINSSIWLIMVDCRSHFSMISPCPDEATSAEVRSRCCRGVRGGVEQISPCYCHTLYIYNYIYWGVRELSIDMPSKLAKRQPYSQSMKEFKRPHVHKKVAIVHPKKHLMSTKRCLFHEKSA